MLILPLGGGGLVALLFIAIICGMIISDLAGPGAMISGLGRWQWRFLQGPNNGVSIMIVVPK